MTEKKTVQCVTDTQIANLLTNWVPYTNMKFLIYIKKKIH